MLKNFNRKKEQVDKVPKKSGDIFKNKVLFIRGIKAKLIISFIIPVILIIALGIISTSKSSEGLINTYKTSTETSLSLTGNYLDLVLNTMTNKAIQLNSDATLTKYYSGTFKNSIIEESRAYSDGTKKIYTFSLADDFVENVIIFSNYGKGISATGSLNTDVYPIFTESEEGKGFQALGKDTGFIPRHPSIDQVTGMKEEDYCLSMVYNLRNTTNKPIGYIVIDLKTEFAVNMLNQIQLGEGSINGFIVDNTKEVINADVPEGFKFSEQEYYKNALASEIVTGSEYVDFNGREYLYVYSKVPNTNMILNSLIPNATINKQADEVKMITIIIVIATCIIAILIGTVMASGIGKVIKHTNSALLQAANGDLTVGVKTRRKDEFKNLAGSINNMISSMKNIIGKMAKVSTTVTSSAGEVNESSEVLLNATKDIAIAANDIEQGIGRQSEDAQMCLNQMEGLASQITTVYENTREIESIAVEAKGTVGKGIVIVDDLNAKAKDTSDITKVIIDNIENLERESHNISSIIATINDISEQTNLLSLNASIEAARAGAAGRGFSVVADEIRKLAEQSSQAAGQISSIIGQIQERTKNTVLTAKKAEEIVDSQELALASTVESFDKINHQVESLTTNLQRISTGIAEIERAKEGTLGSIESISATTEETAAASETLSRAADNQLSAVEGLNKAAERLREDASNLEETVQIFKVD